MIHIFGGTSLRTGTTWRQQYSHWCLCKQMDLVVAIRRRMILKYHCCIGLCQHKDINGPVIRNNDTKALLRLDLQMTRAETTRCRKGIYRKLITRKYPSNRGLVFSTAQNRHFQSCYNIILLFVTHAPTLSISPVFKFFFLLLKVWPHFGRTLFPMDYS